MQGKRILHIGIRLAAIGTLCLFMPLNSHGADLYWVGGSDAWNTPADWSSTLGGPGGAGQPQNGDNVYLTQSDGTNRIIYYYNTLNPLALNSLQIGATGAGTITFSLDSRAHSLTLGAVSEVVGGGLNSTTVNQSDATNSVTNLFQLGTYASSGTYNLSGGVLQVGTEQISGSSVFTQSGGTHTVAGSMNIGYIGGNSTYALTGGALQAGSETLGNGGSGVGAFTQSGGTNTVTGALTLINSTYSLGATGILQAGSVQLGEGGSIPEFGTFTQSGGTATITGTLSMVGQAYNLSAGSLQAGSVQIGTSGTNGGNGAFTQTGGTNTVTGTLYLGATGQYGNYNLSGGNLSTGNTTINIMSTFTQTGGTHTIANTLTLAGQNATYSLSGGSLNASTVSIGGQFNHSGGTAIVSNLLQVGYFPNSGTYSLSGTGVLQSVSESINWGGIFNQTGGTNTVTTTLKMGGSGGTGTYNLSGGSLQVNNDEYLCYGTGTGTFNQSGGNHTIGGTLNMGNGGGTYYNLSGSGFLQAQNANIGNSDGIATFTHTSGTFVVDDTLTLGEPSTATGIGTYYLSGSGVLQAGNEVVQHGGIDGFSQSGGTNIVTGSLAVGAGGGSASRYNLSGGILSSGNTSVSGVMGTFAQTGGTHTVAHTLTLTLATYNLSGGTLSAANIVNNGTFNYSGGTVTGLLQNGGQVNVTGGTSVTPNIFAATVMNNSGGNFNVGDGVNSAYVAFVNAVTNNVGATFTINKSQVTFQSAFVNYGSLVTDPSTVIFDGTFTSESGSSVTGSTGDTYEFLGTGTNTIDLGGKAVTISTLILGQGVTLNVTDGSLTVAELIDPTGSDAGITGNFTADSYGTPDPTPIPGAVLLFAPGLAGIALIRRRLKQ